MTHGAVTQAGSFAAYFAISGLISLALWILLLLPNFLQSRGWSSQRIGWAMGTYFIANLVVQIFAGHLADRFGNLRTALWGTAIGCLAGFAYVVAFWAPGLIFAARLLHAAAAGMGSAAGDLSGRLPSPVRCARRLRPT